MENQDHQVNLDQEEIMEQLEIPVYLGHQDLQDMMVKEGLLDNLVQLDSKVFLVPPEMLVLLEKMGSKDHLETMVNLELQEIEVKEASLESEDHLVCPVVKAQREKLEHKVLTVQLDQLELKEARDIKVHLEWLEFLASEVQQELQERRENED